MKCAIDKRSSICTLLLILTTANSAFAQSTVSSTSLAPSVTASASDIGAIETKKKFSVATALTTETNLEEQSSAQDESATTLEIQPSYRISSKARVQALVAAERSYNGLQETKFLNTTISISRDPIRLDDATNLGLTAQVLLPTDKEARDNSSLRGAAGAVAGVTHEFKLLKKNASVTYALNALKYSHEFSRNADRGANTSYRFRHVGSLDVNLNKKFDVSLGGYYQTGFTYDNVIREAYTLEESLSYSLKKNVALAVSHSTGGPLFEKEGHEWAPSFYDKSASTVGARITVVY